MDWSLPGCSVHRILQAKILEWVAIPFSRGSSQPRDQTQVSCTAGRLFTIWATREADHECVSLCQSVCPNLFYENTNQTGFEPTVITLHFTLYVCGVYVCVLVAQLCLTLLNPWTVWNSPGKNTGVGSHFLLQRIFLTQGLNPRLLHCRWILYHLSHRGSPHFSYLFKGSISKYSHMLGHWGP